MNNTTGGENAALITFAEERGKPPETRELKHDGLTVPYVVDGNGEASSLAHLVDSERTHPKFRRGEAMFTQQRSFEEHAKRFASEHSTLWADRGEGSRPRLVSMLDYHDKGADGTPRFCHHRGVYTFPLAQEWIDWTSIHNKMMPQREFAEFLESHLVDIADPKIAEGSALGITAVLDTSFAPASDLLKLSRGIKVHEVHEVSEHHDLSTGEGEITFKVEHADRQGNRVRVPQAFLLGIPVFRAGQEVTIGVLLRYRVRDGQINWIVSLYRHVQVFDDAFESSCSNAEKNTGLPMYYGKPEQER